MNKRGFTLIELLITVSIIGILSVVAVTSYIGVTKKAARTEAYSNLSSIRLLEEQAFADSGNYVGPAADTAAISGLMRGFRPGGSLNYTYSLTIDQQLNNSGGNTAASPPGTVAVVAPVRCFVATATGIAGTKVCSNAANCDVFAIDCNNNKNY